MKIIILVICAAMLPLLTIAQSKIVTDTLTVLGTCGDCKERIQETTYNVKGVKKVIWNKQTHLLTVTYNNGKTNLQAIAAKLAAIGHDNPLALATIEQYKSLPSCCRYREGAKCAHD